MSWDTELKKIGSDGSIVETLCEDKWMALKRIKNEEHGVSGYTFSHEKASNGKKVAVLPYRKKDDDSLEFLLRHEVTPCWSMDPEISSVTGSVEQGQTPLDNAIIELKEETGYTAEGSEFKELGVAYASKSADTVYYLFAVDVAGKEQGDADGDGSKQDSEATTAWYDKPFLYKDPHLSVLYCRLMDSIENTGI